MRKDKKITVQMVLSNLNIIFIKYPTDSQYEIDCVGQVGWYDNIKGYDVISVDESDITGITTVKLSK